MHKLLYLLLGLTLSPLLQADPSNQSTQTHYDPVEMITAGQKMYSVLPPTQNDGVLMQTHGLLNRDHFTTSEAALAEANGQMQSFDSMSKSIKELQERISKLDDDITAHNRKIGQIQKMRDAAMDDLRQGLYCSGCGKSKSEILATGSVFPHPGQSVLNKPATQEQLDAKYKSFDASIKAEQAAITKDKAEIDQINGEIQHEKAQQVTDMEQWKACMQDAGELMASEAEAKIKARGDHLKDLNQTLETCQQVEQQAGVKANGPGATPQDKQYLEAAQQQTRLARQQLTTAQANDVNNFAEYYTSRDQWTQSVMAAQDHFRSDLADGPFTVLPSLPTFPPLKLGTDAANVTITAGGHNGLDDNIIAVNAHAGLGKVNLELGGQVGYNALYDRQTIDGTASASVGKVTTGELKISQSQQYNIQDGVGGVITVTPPTPAIGETPILQKTEDTPPAQVPPPSSPSTVPYSPPLTTTGNTPP